jgi:HPr kinase/phosphorylase
MTDEQPAISIEAVLRGGGEWLGLGLDLVAGSDGLDRLITVPHVQKTGLAFAGFDEYLHAGRVLVLGESEVRYLERLDAADRRAVIRRALAHDLPCILLTSGLEAPTELVQEADGVGLPVLTTDVGTPAAIARLTAWLDDRLAIREIVHGVLVDVLGLGVLIRGESGIGKSECALDLVVRGHRLVADDAVEVRRRAESVVIGSCPDLTRHYIEIRGLGIINVQELFGVASVRSSKRVELVVQLERWTEGHEYDRLGLDPVQGEILGCVIPMVRLPVAPGRNLAILTEVAARNQLMRARGRRAATELAFRLDQRLQELGDDTDGDLEEGDAE